MISHYDWAGGREAMLRFGPDTGPVVVVALPLFEEANRTRTFVISILRGLAERGIASALPDLPGQGESLLPTEQAGLSLLRSGFAAAVDHLYDEGRRVYSVAIRSGATLDVQAFAVGRWYLSPASGSDVLRDQARILQAAGREVEAGWLRNTFQIADNEAPIEIAGNRVGLLLLEDLAGDGGGYYQPVQRGIPTRVVRLESDRGEAHRHVPGPPLWRRAEPGIDPALAAILADDIAQWIATCER